MKKILLVLLLTSPLMLYATNYSVTWDAVTTAVDGSPLSGVMYKLHCGQASGVYTVEHDNGISTKINDLSFLPTEGQWFCTVSAYKAGYVTSGESEEISFFMLAGQPAYGVLGAPSNFKLDVF